MEDIQKQLGSCISTTQVFLHSSVTLLPMLHWDIKVGDLEVLYFVLKELIYKENCKVLFYAFPVLFSTTSEPCFMEVPESGTKVVESWCSWPMFANWSSYQRQWGNVFTRPLTSLCILHAFNIPRHRSLETCFPSPLWRPLEISTCHWSTYNFKFPTAVYDSVEWWYPIYILGLHGQMELPWCVACAVGLIVQQICGNQKSPYLREPLELWWSALLYIFLIWASGLLLPPDNFFWKNLEER